MSKRDDIGALISGLAEFQKGMRVEEVLEAALADPQPTQERLNQIERALETFKDLGVLGGDDPRDLHLMVTLGRAYERLSHLEKSCETYRGALSLAERTGDTECRADMLSRIGRVLARWNRWDEAIDHLNRSQAVYQELGDRKGQGRVALRRGVAYSRQGDYPSATAAYEEGLGLAEEADDRRTIAAARSNLATLASIRGDLDEAITQLKPCIGMCEEIGDYQGLAGAYHNLGRTYANKKDWSAAMDALEQGFEVAQKHDYLETMANIHLSMADVLLELGNSLMVPFCCARALDIYKKLGNHLGEADTYRLLAKSFVIRKEWSTAESLFKDALRLNEEYGDPLGVAETLRDLGKMQVAQKHKQDARKTLEASLDEFRKLGAEGDVKEVEELIDSIA